jgi:hypothetical protein
MAAQPLEREEYIEQTYLFRVLRERMSQNMPAQEILERIDQEILATTRLPMAVQFLSTELKHTGSLASGFLQLAHYFTGFQAHVMACSENEQLLKDCSFINLNVWRAINLGMTWAWRAWQWTRFTRRIGIVLYWICDRRWGFWILLIFFICVQALTWPISIG